jgi:hypothetical protein
MLLLLLFAPIAVQPVGFAEKIDFLRMSFKANKEAFAFGTIQFEYTKGRCASLSDAESEVFSQSIKEDGLYVFDGKNERYDLLAEPAALAAVTTRVSKNKTSSIAQVFRALTDGEVTLLDQLWVDDSKTYSHRSPEIYPGTRMFHRSAYFKFPLALCNCEGISVDLFCDLTAVKEGRGTLTELDFDSRLDGLAACKLSYTYPGGKCTYWIDLTRGCLPLRIQTQYNRAGGDVIYRFGDFEHVAGAGWIPRRSFHVWADGHLADLVVISKIDVVNRPARSMFQLGFPAPVSLHDQARQLIHPKRKTWSLLDLPDASSRGTRAFAPQRIAQRDTPEKRPGKAPSPLFAGEMPGEVEPRFDRSIIAGALIVFFIVASVVFAWRLSRRHQRQGA